MDDVVGLFVSERVFGVFAFDDSKRLRMALAASAIGSLLSTTGSGSDAWSFILYFLVVSLFP